MNLIRDQNPDAILLAGDMIDNASSDESTLEFMRGAANIAPCLYVSGSHDLWKLFLGTDGMPPTASCSMADRRQRERR